MTDCSIPLSISSSIYLFYGFIILLFIFGALMVTPIFGIDSLVTWFIAIPRQF
jgi:hypothetical protein